MFASPPLLLRSYNIPTIFDSISDKNINKNLNVQETYRHLLMQSIVYGDYQNVQKIASFLNNDVAFELNGFTPQSLAYLHAYKKEARRLSLQIYLFLQKIKSYYKMW